MRRPPPLPAAADRPAPDDEARTASTDDPREDDRTEAADPGSPSPAERAEGETVPLVLAPLGDGESTGLPADAVSEADPPVRLREVWAAARARRRALRSEVRRFTVRQRRRRRIWLGVAASLVILVAITLGAAYSPLFAVERIRVIGASQLDADGVEAALVDQLGTPLALVDDGEVKAALVTFPLVESYTLEARPPHELVVRIVERTPIGYLETPAGFSLVDAAGVVLSTVQEPGADAPILQIDGGTTVAAFDAAGLVMRSLPESIRPLVTGVAASTPDDVTLTLGGTETTVVWGSAEDSALKAVVLDATMTARPPGTVSVYDVSSPSAVVFN